MAVTMDAIRIQDHFRLRLPAILDSIREIVEIESPSRDEAGSAEVTGWIERRLVETGCPVEIRRVPSPGIGDHLVIRAFADASGSRPTLLLGHTDTVHPVGAKAQNPTRIEGDRYYGCGVFDMKANIVLMIEVLRYFAETRTLPSRPITIVLSCDEEVGSYTGREHVEREARLSAECLVFEPSAGGKVKTGRKGTGMFTVKAHGVPAHAGLDPEKGASAILELARQIERLNKLNAPDAGTTVNVCTIEGGTTSNVIPEYAECSVDVRFTTAVEGTRIEREIRSLTAVDARVSLEVTGALNRPPMERTEAVVALFERTREIGASYGYEVDETQVGGASDGNFVGAVGTPVLDGLGVAGDGAHTLGEYILISDITPRAALLTMLLMS